MSYLHNTNSMPNEKILQMFLINKQRNNKWGIFYKQNPQTIVIHTTVILLNNWIFKWHDFFFFLRLKLCEISKRFRNFKSLKYFYFFFKFKKYQFTGCNLYLFLGFSLLFGDWFPELRHFIINLLFFLGIIFKYTSIQYPMTYSA